MSNKRLETYLLKQLNEPSTYRGLTLCLMAGGIQVSPENAELIMTLGLFVAGMIGALVPDSLGAKEPPDHR